MRPKCRVTQLVILPTVALVSATASGGDLNPPGAPAATPGLDPRIPINAVNTPSDGSAEFVISGPGSYILEGDIAVAPGLSGIRINADGVTLDLMGFTLAGPVSPGPVGRGIWPLGLHSNITVRNGTLTGWDTVAIDLAAVDRATVENLSIEGNTLIGISVGNDSLVSGCRVFGNGGGIQVDPGSIVTDCVVSGGGGVSFPGACLVVGCVLSDGGNGVSQSAGSGALVIDNVCRNNALDGITVVSDSFVRGNTCSRNGPLPSDLGAGVEGRGDDNRIESNHLDRNGYGVLTSQLSTDNVVIRNSASNSTQDNYQLWMGNDPGPLGTAATATSPWANMDN